ncbi:MAG: cytochrome c, partial [Burkholderia sp.]|nr:cytochrome c [Burkholderia sp.]
MKNILKGFGAALSVALPLLMQASAAAAATSSAFDLALVQRGAYLAKAGDCAACHTAPKGKPFAGGLPMNTPMGQIYTTNITPDSQTGIGG